MSFEIVEGFSTGLGGVGFADGAVSVFLSVFFFLENGLDLVGPGSSLDSGHLVGELEPPDGDELSLDVFAIDEDSFVVEDVNDGGDFTFLRTVDNSGNTTDLDEPLIALNR